MVRLQDQRTRPIGGPQRPFSGLVAQADAVVVEEAVNAAVRLWRKNIENPSYFSPALRERYAAQNVLRSEPAPSLVQFFGRQ